MQSFKNITKVHKQKVKSMTIVNSYSSSRLGDPFRYKINCKNLIHLSRWQLPCNASSLRIDHYNMLIYHELGAHIPMLLVVIHDLFTTFHPSFHYNHQFKIPYMRQTWMHNTNNGEITSQCVLIRNEMKMNHATMEVNGMIKKF
jgi:hypothetical protein